MVRWVCYWNIPFRQFLWWVYLFNTKHSKPGLGWLSSWSFRWPTALRSHETFGGEPFQTNQKQASIWYWWKIIIFKYFLMLILICLEDDFGWHIQTFGLKGWSCQVLHHSNNQIADWWSNNLQLKRLESDTPKETSGCVQKKQWKKVWVVDGDFGVALFFSFRSHIVK